jgi:beta-lactamase superfamily II metal-dependent hydrolase
MIIRFLKAGNGDAILMSFKENDINRNILIDSGVSSTYYSSSTNEFGDLKTEIDNIKKRDEVLDLVILSHIDNDHICGLIEWFRRDMDAYMLIKNVWFNSGKTIAQFLKKPENIDLDVELKIFTDPKTGVNEGIEFEDYLLEKKIWDQQIVKQGQSVEYFGIKIEVLSPDKNQLNRLLKEYKRVTSDDAYTAAKEKDWNRNIKDFIEEENKTDFKFKQDTSVKNGSSISFIITVGKCSFLFLGDSHPKGIVKYLQKLKYSKDEPLNVDLIKVAHHGSKSNTNKELLEIVRSTNYYISTDGSEHNHPNKRTLARILQSNPDAVFHFNYEHIRDQLFSKQDREDFTIKARVTTQMEFEL